MLKQASTLLALFVLALGATPGAALAAGWQPSVNAETGDDAGFATEVAVDTQGNAVAVWARHVFLLEWEIVASSRPRGGKWTVPVAISGDTRTGEILRSKVAVDPSGNAIAVWVARPPQTGGDATFKTLWSASRSPGGAWSEPEEISVASGVSEFDVVIDASGTATAIWHSLKEGEDDPPGSFVRASSRPLDGAWSEPAELSGTANGANPQVAVNPDGDLTAVWTGIDPDTGNTIVRSKSRPTGGAWSVNATDLSSDAGRASDAQVAVDPDGDATAVWSYSEEDPISGDDDIAVQAAHRSGGTWNAPIELWDDATDEAFPEVALTDWQGDATAIWSSFGPGGDVMRSSTSTAGGAWSSPVELSAPDGGDLIGKPTNPRIVADAQGGLTATWSAAVGPNPGIGVTEIRQLQAVHLPAGGRWGSPVALSAPDDLWAAEIAADPQGYVTALWVGTTAVRSRVFDAVAPLLDNVTVPTSGVVGQPVEMSVNPFDVWSSVTTGWDFGDGGSGSGATVSHCYSTPGEHTVTIAGTDLAANATSATRTIEIEADPNAGSDPCAPPDPGPGPGPDPKPNPSPGPRPNPGPGTDPNPIAPVVTGLQQSSSRWRARALGRRLQLPIGTVFRFRLNRAADVKLPFARIVPVGKAKPRGTLHMAGKAGANAFGFRGKIRGRTLAPGRYRLTVTAHADGMTSPGVSIEFTIVR